MRSVKATKFHRNPGERSWTSCHATEARAVFFEENRKRLVLSAGTELYSGCFALH
jgi:hypothetical protein